MSDTWIAQPANADFINAVVNDPSVADWVRGPITGALDLAPLLSDRRNHVLVGRYGFSVFRESFRHLYDWHAAVLPQGRGRWALGAARASLDWLFSRTNAVAVVASIPAPNRPARHVVAALGFTLITVMPSAWPMPNGRVPLMIYCLCRKQWGAPCQ